MKQKVFMMLRGVVGTLITVLALAGCGGGDTTTLPSTANTSTTTNTTNNTGTTVSGYTLKSGETVATGLNVSMLDGKTFYWSQEGVQYGAISFSNSGGTASGTGTFSVTAPQPSSKSSSWNAPVILNSMPIIVAGDTSIYTFNIIAFGTNYYVVSWTTANVSGTKYARWYFGNGASSAAATFAGNPAVIPAQGAFTTADFSGKTFCWVGGSAYQEAVFNADGTVLASDAVTTGVPGNLTHQYGWQVSNGVLQITNGTTTTTYAYSEQVPMSIPLSNAFYYRVIRNNGSINAFVYEADFTKELAAAEALATVGGPQ